MANARRCGRAFGLEDYLQPEVNGSIRRSQTGDRANTSGFSALHDLRAAGGDRQEGSGRAQIAVGQAEIRSVRQVKEFRPELHLEAVAKLEVLHHRRVQIVESRSTQNAAAGASVMATVLELVILAGHGAKGFYIEPAADVTATQSTGLQTARAHGTDRNY